MNDVDLMVLAQDIYHGRVFTDRHLKNVDEAGMVFMPLVLGALSDMPKEKAEDIGMIYEYMSNAGPLAINGQPSFFSFNLLTKAEATIVWENYDKVRLAMENLSEDLRREGKA